MITSKEEFKREVEEAYIKLLDVNLLIKRITDYLILRLPKSDTALKEYAKKRVTLMQVEKSVLYDRVGTLDDNV